MLFNSLEFLIFLPIVIWIYFSVPYRWRWLWLLAASYYFYMSWKPIYGILLLTTTLVDYVVAMRLGRAEAPSLRRLLLGISLVTNLGVLFFFKYYNFIADSFNSLFGWFSLPPRLPHLDLVLPIGISFYVLQTLGYVIDVYRRRLSPEPHLGILMLYVSFFPQLVAGPIERAGNLLPQFRKKFRFDEQRAGAGLKLIAWGFFKKIVIADNLSFYVDPVFATPENYAGWAVLVAAYFFAFQIYCDFSGYSDIAIGCARILGIDLMNNFRRPFLSRSIREFWQRWHISLTSWLRDYVYFPLGGSRVATQGRADANILIVFLLSGLWHGAQWTFIAWGVLNGLFYLITRWFRFPMLDTRQTLFRPIYHLAGIFLTFNMFAVTLVFFRANSITDAFQLLFRLAYIIDPTRSGIGGDWLQLNFDNLVVPSIVFVGLAVLMSVEILQEWKISIRGLMGNWPVGMRWAAYYLFAMVIVIFGSYSTQTTFIYFQF